MVEQIRKELVDRWALLLLVAVFSGGSSTLGNLMAGGATAGSDREISDQLNTIASQLTSISTDQRDMKYQLRTAAREKWNAPMMESYNGKLGKELRKVVPSWEGPDVAEIKKLHGEEIP